MTHRALQISAQLTAAMSATGKGGRLVPPLPPVPRDGLAALACWHVAGRRIERLREGDIQIIPPDVRLDVTPIPRQGVGYILLERRDWIILGRIPAKQPVQVAAGMSYAYPEPMLVYVGWRGGDRRSIRAGAINLAHSPTVDVIRLVHGDRYRDGVASPLITTEADEDLLAVGMCLPRFLALI